MSSRPLGVHSGGRTAQVGGSAANPDTASVSSQAATALTEPTALTQATAAAAVPEGHADLALFPRNLPAAQVHAELRRCLSEMHRAERSAFLWFTELVQRRLYRELGYASVQAYASEELGLTANRVNRYLRLMQDLERLPRIRVALCEGKIGWTKARAIVRVSSPATEARWLAAAGRLGRRELEAKVVRARMAAAARRRGNPAQPELAAAVERSGGGGESARRPAASGESPCELAVAPMVEREGDGIAVAAPLDGSQCCSSGAEALTVSPGGGGEPLTDDGPVSVVLRFDPLELARFESQIEKLRKQGRVDRGASREQIVLGALEALVTGPEAPSRGAADRPLDHAAAPAGAGEPGAVAEPVGAGEPGAVAAPAGATGPGAAAEPAGAGEHGADHAPGHGLEREPVTLGPSAADAVPRGTVATPYNIVIYRCGLCQAAVVQTSRGPLKVAAAGVAAAECEGVVSTPGKPNRAAIPPALRREVLTRDRHRCRAAGCGHTGFLEVHHIVPRERGGTNRPENLVTLCSRCHVLWHAKRLDARLLGPVPG